MFSGKVDHKGARYPHIGKVIGYRTILTLLRLCMTVLVLEATFTRGGLNRHHQGRAVVMLRG